MIDLVCGDPWDKEGFGPGKPASYSRFLLPFSYKLKSKRSVGKPTSFYYEAFSTESFAPERSLYFTSETAKVLYERATWARIPQDVWERKYPSDKPFHFNAQKSKHRPEVILSPPWLILFEGECDDSKHELLHHGFLVLEARFSHAKGKMPSSDDLLEFNEMFRYIDCPYPGHAEDFKGMMAEFPYDFSSNEKLGECDEQDRLFYKNRWLSLLGLPLYNKGKLYSLVPESSFNNEKNTCVSEHLSCNADKCLIYADNRAFVWTCALLDGGTFSITEEFGNHTDDKKDSLREPWAFGHWLRLLNVDQPEDSPQETHDKFTEFQKAWLKEHTYHRWEESGTLYGYCYHGGAMLSSSCAIPPLWYHFGQMYFDQILLLFYLRITLFAFSRQLTHINVGDGSNSLLKEFQKLRRSFAKFTNLYQFPLISNQQQGVEMYDLARKRMDIDDLFSDVQNEITSTHEFLEMKASASLGTKANYIALIGAIIAVLALPEAIAKPFWNFFKNLAVVLGVTGGVTALAVLIWSSWKYNNPKWLWKIFKCVKG